MKKIFACLAAIALSCSSYGADGDLDPTFSGDGINSVSFGQGDVAYGGFLQPDGKLLVVGGARPVANEEFAVARFNADGSVDTGFATNGKFSLDITLGTVTDRATCVGLQSDGKIIVGGFTRIATGNDDFVVLRLTTTGALDSSFGTGGVVTIDFTGTTDRAVGLAVLADNSIVVSGTTAIGFETDFALTRLTAEGALDFTFGTGGRSTFDVNAADGPQAMAMQTDGKIIVAGYTAPAGTNLPIVVRFEANGAVDTTFGNGGTGYFSELLTTAGEILYDVKVAGDGKIVAAGYCSPSGTLDGMVLRLNDNGTLDTTFSAPSGFGTYNMGSTSDSFRSILLLPDGKYLAGGCYNSGTHLDSVLVRMENNGIPDLSFGLTKTVSIAAESDIIIEMFQAADGKIVAAVDGQTSGVDTDFYAARFEHAATGAPEIVVRGNSVDILDADMTPSTGDGTDFGPVFTGGTLAHSFSIANTGTAALTLSGTPRVSLSNTTDFSVTTQPASGTVAAGGNVGFVITFAPASAGTKSTSVNIINDDADESFYTFGLTGLGASPLTGSTGSGDPVSTVQPVTKLQYIIATTGVFPSDGSSGDSDPMLGEIRLFTGNFIPGGWEACEGQVMQVNTNQALFAVLGTSFGGDGITTFMLPDLRGRVPVGTSEDLPLGTQTGAVTVNLTAANLPPHAHSWSGGLTSITGTGAPVDLQQPSLALTHMINVVGVFNTLTEIRLFAGTFVPNGWRLCDGAILPIAGNNVIFQLLGTTYGGDGVENFALPDLRGRAMMSNGDGAGLTPRPHGTVSGSAAVALTQANLPPHVHSTFEGTTSSIGSGTAIDNTQPSVAVTMAIRAFGLFPSESSSSSSGMMMGEGRFFAYNPTTFQNQLGSGWFLLDGSLQPISEYDTLFALIGTTYGGDGEVNFGVPDARGRLIMGALLPEQGQKTGAETLVLSGGQLPPHTHSLADAEPEIVVSGNGVEIPDGDVSPGTADHTDFDSTPVTGGVVSRVFTISNTGDADLTLSGTAPNYVTLTGDVADFSVSIQPASATVTSVAPQSFTVTFNPASAGAKIATVSIGSNDADENPYTFAVTGEGVAPGPLVTALGDVVSSEPAPGEDGTTDIGDFGLLRRGGFLADNGSVVFPGNLVVGSGVPAVTAATSSGMWKLDTGNLYLLARSGTTVPNVPGAQFATLPEVPGISDEGESSFLGTLVIGTGGVTVNNDTGLWSELGGTGLELLVREDDDLSALPGLAGVRIGKFASGIYATATTGATTGEAVFSVTFKGASTRTAILRASVSGTGTALSAVAVEGNPAPGTAANFANVAGSYSDPGRMDAQGNLVVAAITTPGNKDGVWYQPLAGSLAKVFIGGDTAPGTSGAKFAKLYYPSIGSNGFIAFRASLNNEGDNTTNTRNDGIWAGPAATPGSITCILRRGDGAAVVSNLPGGALVGNPWGGWLSNGNLGAWKAWLDLNGNFTSSAADGDVHGIYTNLSGSMLLGVQANTAAPGGGGATLSGFDLPVVGGDNQYAFLGTLSGTGVTPDNNAGLWRSAPDGGALTLVLRKGETVVTAGASKVVTKIDLPGSNQTDRRWEQPVMDATGRLLVYVTFDDGSTSQMIIP